MNALLLILRIGRTLLDGFGLMPVFQVFAASSVVFIFVRVVIWRFSKKN